MKREWGLVFTGLGLAVILSLFLSPFASDKPDGLERVAEDAGFAAHAETVVRAPMEGYAMPQKGNRTFGFAGLVGTVAVFGAAYGVGRVLSRRRKTD